MLEDYLSRIEFERLKLVFMSLSSGN
ncbi:hypothetical protein SAMN05421752_1121 [Natronorubrum thiooxidans]|uniref:Uncharacterized protein n=1 Tax=Natronorubrum thiooxidans TaxID=308853 RepID=A0A1N7GG24_9EURY|nr:hypothetical protein SAMN05421752_1121 [Natronorubrum thiooxidans]